MPTVLPTVLQLAELSNNVYSDSSIGFQNWRRSNKLPPMKGKDDGFFGAAYFNGDSGAAVIAYRGSDELINDWVLTDGRIALSQLPINQVADAFDWAGKVKRFAATLGFPSLYITGHSLGGGLAAVVAANLSSSIGVTFNAPGMGALSSAVHFGMKNQENVVNFRAADDPVSRVGKRIGQPPISIQVVPLLARIALDVSLNELAEQGAVQGYSHMIGPLIAGLRRSAYANKTPEEC